MNVFHLGAGGKPEPQGKLEIKRILHDAVNGGYLICCESEDQARHVDVYLSREEVLQLLALWRSHDVESTQ